MPAARAKINVTNFSSPPGVARRGRSSRGNHKCGEAGMEEISSRRWAPRWRGVARILTVVALAASCLTAAGMTADANGNRVNLAMVAQHPADQLWFLSPAFAGSRASFGVQFGNTVFYTMHGLSGGGNDVPNMVNRIVDGSQANRLDYAILGDFNRDPSTLIGGPLRPAAHIYRSGRAT